MKRVLCFGGFFLRADDPEALADWGGDPLGVWTPGEYETPRWRQKAGRQKAGECVFAAANG